MKFIKTVDGDYINDTCVKRFHASVGGGVYVITKDGDIFAVNEFPTAEQAQAYLDKLVDELNEAES